MNDSSSGFNQHEVLYFSFATLQFPCALFFIAHLNLSKEISGSSDCSYFMFLDSIMVSMIG